MLSYLHCRKYWLLAQAPAALKTYVFMWLSQTLHGNKHTENVILASDSFHFVAIAPIILISNHKTQWQERNQDTGILWPCESEGKNRNRKLDIYMYTLTGEMTLKHFLLHMYHSVSNTHLHFNIIYEFANWEQHILYCTM